MSIIYTLIAKNGNTVLAEFTEFQGNFAQISASILKNVKPNTKESLTYDNQFNFYYINENDITYLCMSDSSFPSDISFQLLYDVKAQFLTKYNNNQIKNAIAYSLNNEFRDTLRIKVDYYSKMIDRANDSINKIKESLLNTKDHVIENSFTLNQRAERFNVVAEKADQLKLDTENYFLNSQKMKRIVKCKKIKLYVGIAIAVILVIFFIYLFFR